MEIKNSLPMLDRRRMSFQTWHHICLCPYLFYEAVESTCPCFAEVFGVAVFSEGQIKCLRPVEGELPLIPLSPAGQIPLITKEMAIQKAHQVAGELPHFTTQFLKSEVLTKRMQSDSAHTGNCDIKPQHSSAKYWQCTSQLGKLLWLVHLLSLFITALFIIHFR